MKRTALLRRTPLSRGKVSLRRTRLASRSPSKAADDAKYRAAKAEHFAEHPRCQHPDGCNRSLLKGDLMDLHHRAGRRGPLLYCKKYFATACRPHHDEAKNDPKKSRASGWVVDVSSEEVRQLKLAEL
jgi:hypothetical protein